MNKLTKKEIYILSITVMVWSVILVGSGLIMSTQTKPIIKTKYTVGVDSKKIAQTQAKTNEIKIKKITLEINTPLSVDIKDYLENADKISEDTLKQLKIDTSLVNINQAGTYKYIITYDNQQYNGEIIIKEKELPNVTLTLKEKKLIIGETLDVSNLRNFIEEEITDEVYNNLTLDISDVKKDVAGTYEYYITYKGIKYQGKIIVENPPAKPTIIIKKCPNDAKAEDNTCICNDENKEYDETDETCKEKIKEDK